MTELWNGLEAKGIRPYYKDDDVFIINDDCRNVLPILSAKSIDLILTDPPYGMNYFSNHYIGNNPHKEIANDDEYPSDLIPQFCSLSKKAVLSFCRWNNLKSVLSPKSFVVWVKNNWTAGDLNHEYARQWEGILFYAMENHKWDNRPSDVIFCDRVPPLYHPTEKPIELITKLILQNTSIGDIILDPFMGCGTTLVSAKNAHRKAIGIEIEEKYCKIAATRCSQSVMNLYTEEIIK